MHLRSHIAAFQAQWIIRYLDPRDAPWKHILDQWILLGEPETMERGIIMSRNGLTRAENIPASCDYMRACFKSFAQLNIRQESDLANHESQGEPVWESNRFDISDGVDDHRVDWHLHLDTHRISDLMGPDGAFFDNGEWRSIIRTLARTVYGH